MNDNNANSRRCCMAQAARRKMRKGTHPDVGQAGARNYTKYQGPLATKCS